MADEDYKSLLVNMVTGHKQDQFNPRPGKERQKKKGWEKQQCGWKSKHRNWDLEKTKTLEIWKSATQKPHWKASPIDLP